MNNIEFVKKVKQIATDYKTLYVWGAFGAPMNAKNKKRYCDNPNNKKVAGRIEAINTASADTFGFDCSGLIKAVLWGWAGEKSKTYGGAKYETNGLPDISANTMIKECTDVSTDFSKIEVGELVWISGHIGIYIGDGLVVESTSKWDSCVQITACNCTKSGYKRRNWTKHGKFKYIDYVKNTTAKPVTNTEVTVEVLENGARNDTVKALQVLLIGYGYGCGSAGADGSFGANTDKAVRAYQKDKSLTVDGIVGPATWKKLLGAK